MKSYKASTRRLAEAGGREIEVKLPVADPDEMRRRLRRLRAKPHGVRVHEINTLYDTPEGVLRGSGRLLRIRVQRPATGAGTTKKPPNANKTVNLVRSNALLTYKGPVQPNVPPASPAGHSYKVRDERECTLPDPEAIAGILEGIGLHPSFRYEKYRSSFRLPGLPGLKVELDETPIGHFLELEGGSEAIDRAAKLLGYGPSDYVTRSYPALYMEYGSRQPIGEKPGKSSPVHDRANMLLKSEMISE